MPHCARHRLKPQWRGRSALALRPLQLEPSTRVALSLSTRYDRAVPIVAETDAVVIARGIPSAPGPLAEEPEGAASLCAPPSQREFETDTRSGRRCSPPPGPAGWPRRQRVRNERQAQLPAARREQATEEPVFSPATLSSAPRTGSEGTATSAGRGGRGAARR